jgi:AcrR family transcriptional regulator
VASSRRRSHLTIGAGSTAGILVLVRSSSKADPVDEPAAGGSSGREPSGLSVDRILEVAVKICEQDGFEAISMRRLADELSVSPMAMYRHVETKHALLELIADKYIAELDLAEDIADWRQRLTRIFCSLRELLAARPVLAHVLVAQPADGPPAYAMADAVLGVLRSHGFSDADAVEMFAVLSSYTVGFSLMQRSRFRPGSAEAVRRIAQLKQAEQHPNLSAVAGDFVRWPRQEVFETGLARLLGSGSSAAPRG